MKVINHEGIGKIGKLKGWKWVDEMFDPKKSPFLEFAAAEFFKGWDEGAEKWEKFKVLQKELNLTVLFRKLNNGSYSVILRDKGLTLFSQKGNWHPHIAIEAVPFLERYKNAKDMASKLDSSLVRKKGNTRPISKV